MASSLSISPQPVMPASVEIFTNTQEFLRTKDSILVTLMVSFGPTCGRVGLLRAPRGVETERGGAAKQSAEP